MLDDLVPWKVRPVQHQHGTVIPGIATIVARRKNRDAAAFVQLHVASAVLGHLVAPDDKPTPVVSAERRGDVGAELEADATLRLELAVINRRVAPEHVRKQLVLDILGLRMRGCDAMVVDRVDEIRLNASNPRQPAVDDEDLLGDDGAKGHNLEGRLEAAVCGQAILADHLVLEAAAGLGVQRVHVLVLVVAAVDDQGLRVSQEERKQDHQDLDAMRPAIHHVTVEEVGVRRRRGPKLVQDVQHVGQLPVRVAHDDHPAVAPGREPVRPHDGLRVPGLVQLREL
mmetsp:Transcript_21858/g.65145  ORF Transcript_21858/g.65145 Transcript_21858/m.65145 type:complete len:284 (+) Transcript_21858:1627-2478(+)